MAVSGTSRYVNILYTLMGAQSDGRFRVIYGHYPGGDTDAGTASALDGLRTTHGGTSRRR